MRKFAYLVHGHISHHIRHVSASPDLRNQHWRELTSSDVISYDQEKFTAQTKPRACSEVKACINRYMRLWGVAEGRLEMGQVLTW
jgi:hypothetical protein